MTPPRMHLYCIHIQHHTSHHPIPIPYSSSSRLILTCLALPSIHRCRASASYSTRDSSKCHVAGIVGAWLSHHHHRAPSLLSSLIAFAITIIGHLRCCRCHHRRRRRHCRRPSSLSRAPAITIILVCQLVPNSNII